MDSILQILEAIKAAEIKAHKIIKDTLDLKYKSSLDLDDKDKVSNVLFYMDNLCAIENLISNGYSNSFDLIYLDPPFFTNSIFNKNISITTSHYDLKLKVPVYSDNWQNSLFEYLEMITTRLILMRDLLSDQGTIYVHIDWRVVHYVRLILDYVFGKERFLNEIIWSYKSGGAGRRSFSKKHDNILVYTKSKSYIFNVSKEKSYNREFKPYRFKNVLEYEDEKGWYTLVNSKDVWNIDMVGRTSSERVDYATQKPYKLLEKIILTSSNKDSLIGDFFVGSGTSLLVAEKLQRRWVGSDNSIHSIIQVKKRLRDRNGAYNYFYKKNGDSMKTLRNIKCIKNNNYLEVDLKDISLDLENEMQDYFKGKDINEIDYFKDNAFLFLDYISISSSLNRDFLISDFFRPEIASRLIIPYSSENLENIFIKSVDVWGNEYTNNLDMSFI